MTTKRIALMAGVALGIAPVASADIEILLLSDFSSNGTPAEVLDATWQFEVVGSILTITVTNDTMAPDEYNMNQLYWNAPDGVSLTLDNAPNRWGFDDAGSMVDGFGIFDFGLTNPSADNHVSNIQPGETLVATFNIFGDASAADFASSFSSNPPGGITGVIAAKFVMGPNDDSAFGMTVPTPGVLALMGVAGVIVARPRRRRD